ncbi:putative TRAP dicarboxylate transporter- DctP subunit [Aurantimonas manganoxydans SI85-9A1]|uniref:Tripartite ATP-independent periplasmic transporter DctQ n=2 Tax=Aurantimonas manganoxydans TaxID=651183 RepID=A0A0P0Z5L3_9HYPH|nr:C4-dicarboxylate TRAP transporter substrate-binding protein [Aurantimonas manganoxydans]EAS50132.1 putative TRAP dicarboxylate transporter- DctP subunit [Aurantimonas manganoxydans SI85-9A1]BAT29360.1 tripartite ATP-independent periplasmic transporter DctQ [Aurantimonas manganoxydans SI85-9A1]
MSVLARHLKTLSLVVGLGLFAQGAVFAQDSFELRFNHVLGPNEPFHKGFEAWAERVKERTDGGLTIQVFHSAQLGVEEDIIEQIRQGANIGQNTDAARLGTYVPGIAVVNGPYFVSSLEESFKLADSPTMQEWQAELAEQHGLKVVCFDWVQGFRNFYTNGPVRTPEDLSGQRIRTPPAPIWQESIRALGAEPVAMNFGDVYPGLQQRAIDGAELVYPNITAANLNEVVDHANETKHILLTNFQVVSSQWFDGLPPEYQTALVEECRAAGQATSAEIEEATQTAKATLKERGMTIVEDVDMEAFRAAGEKAYETLGLVEAKNTVQEEIGIKAGQ